MDRENRAERPKDHAPKSGDGSWSQPSSRKRSQVNPASLGLARGCKPVREIAKKSRRISRPGIFASAKTINGRAVRTESILEMEGLAHIEVNSAYVRVAPQPHRLTFHVEAGNGSTEVHTYVPDVAVETRDGTVIVLDFKWSWLRKRPGWADVEPIIRTAYALDHGVTYRVLTEEHLLVEPRRTNVAIMLMHRPMVADAAAITAVRSAIATLGLPRSIGDLRSASGLIPEGPTDRAFSAIMELAIAGEIRIEMSQPFGEDSLVSVGARQ